MTETEKNIRSLSPHECNKLLERNKESKDFVVWDLRSPEKYHKNKLKGAINFNYDDENFDDELEKLDRNKIYLIYCSSKAKSNIVFGMMEDLGFKNVYKIEGGITAWFKAGFSLEHDE